MKRVKVKRPKQKGIFENLVVIGMEMYFKSLVLEPEMYVSA